MANEFIIKNGYFSQGNSTITGSLTISSSGTDTLRILKGASDVVQQGSSVYLVGDSGSSYTQLQQGVGRFTIWGYNGSVWGEKFTINSTTGNTGIGTSTPFTKLTVDGTVSLTSTANSTSGSLYIDHQGVQVWKFGVSASNTSTLSIGNDLGGAFANKILNITNVGNIGIGTTSPLTPLHVYVTSSLGAAGVDGIRISDNQTLSTAINLGVNTPGTYAWIQSAQGGVGPKNLILNPAGGNVGIGTTSPNTKLDVNGNAIITGSLTVTAGITGSLFGTASWANNSVTASYFLTSSVTSASLAQTASYLNTLNQNLTFNGNLTLNGTASITYLNVAYESSSIIFSSGSNQFGDAVADTQTLMGTVKITGSLNVTGSANIPSITGSLLGTASWANNAITSSYVVTAQTASYILNAVSASRSQTASFVTPLTQNVQITGSLIVSASGTTNDLLIGTNKLFVSSSGNVGIGTVTPNYKLSVQTSEPTFGIVQAISNNNGGNATSGSKLLWDQSGVGNFWEGMPGGVNAWAVGLYNGSTNPEYLRIGSTGNVGIGMAPSHKFEVYNGSRSNTPSYSNATAWFAGLDVGLAIGNYDNVSYGTWLSSIRNNNTEYALTLQPLGGTVGIGKALPNAILDVNGNTIISGSLTTTGLITANQLKYTRSINISNTDLNALTDAGFYNGSTLNNGPTSVGWYWVTVERYDNDANWVHQTATSFGSGNTTNRVYTRTNLAGTWQVWKELVSTNIVAGTTAISTGSLSVPGDISMLFGNSLRAYSHPYSKILETGYDGTLTQDFLKIYTAGDGANNATTKITVLRDGNVGIGTTSPNTKLDINGSVNIASGLGNTSTRPTVSAGSLTLGELRAYSTDFDSVGDDGFVRISAGGGTNINIKSYIDLSGYSTIPDMNKNIVLGTSGTERMRIDVNGNVGIGTTSPTKKLSVATGSITADEYYFNNEPNTAVARRSVGGVVGVNNVSYTTICNVVGGTLASGIRISLMGTTSGNVVSVVADILVNHSTDIYIESKSGIYTLLTLKVISDNNENFTIQAITNVANAVQLNVEVFPLSSETITFNPTGIYTGATLIHPCIPGLNISATGGTTAENGNLSVLGRIGIGTTSPNAKLDVNGNVIITGSLSNGNTNQAIGTNSHAEGELTNAFGPVSHAEGAGTFSPGIAAHAEGYYTTASGQTAHAEGTYTKAIGNSSHAEGYFTVANLDYAHAEGNRTLASGTSSHAEGYYTTASGQYAHSEGAGYVLSGEGTFYYPVIASGYGSHAEGYGTKARATGSHSEGDNTTADGVASHAEGGGTWASGSYSHAEGQDTYAFGPYSHTEGYNTSTNGYYSHAEGQGTIASASAAHAEGYYTYAYGNYSHTAGNQTVAIGTYQSVIGMMNISSSAEGAFIIGNGNSSIGTRSNLVFASGSTFQVTGSIIATAGITGSFSGDGSGLTGISSAANIANTNLTITAAATRVLNHQGTSRFIISGSTTSENPMLELNSPLLAVGRLFRMQQQLNNEPNRTAARSFTAGGQSKDDSIFHGWATDYIAESISGSTAISPNRLKGFQWASYNGANYTSLLTISSSGQTNLAGNLILGGFISNPNNSINYLGNVAIGNSNEIWVPTPGGVDELYLNYRGENNAYTQFRNTGIYNGKQSIIGYFDGTNRRFGIGTNAPTHQLTLTLDQGAKPSTNTWTITSDSRIKENIIEADYNICYDIVKNLPLKRYTWKQEAYTNDQVPDRSKLGWIAQDVETIFPKAVEIQPFSGSGDFYIEDCRNLNSDQIYAAMYGTIKKLINENDILKSEIQLIKTHLGL